MIIRLPVPLFATLVAATLLRAASPDVGSQLAREQATVIRPGQPGNRPFWNGQAKRFIYAPAFDFAAQPGATRYHFTARVNGRTYEFDAAQPSAPLTPIWSRLPEGVVDLTVTVTSAAEAATPVALRTFYRHAPFSGEAPVQDYAAAGRLGLRAILHASNVQAWLQTGQPEPTYRHYCYPSKVMGGLLRAMAAYAQTAAETSEREQARLVATRVGAYLLGTTLGNDTAFPHFPPTYLENVAQPYAQAVKGVAESQLMLNSPCDAALGYLDYHDLSHEAKYLEAARAIAATYARTQEPDGTWPLLVNFRTGRPITPNRLVPTWVIQLFDRLDRQYGISEFRPHRARAWDYIVKNPLRTFAWDAQFEDVKPVPPYRNLAREQACDVAIILCQLPTRGPAELAQARELLAFAEDQFVIWTPVSDPAGAIRAGLRKNIADFMPPCVLEQYNVYEPVARSSAVLINAYLAAYTAMHEELFLHKARALANGLVAAQHYQMAEHGGTGEIPTWLVRRPPSNWLNNSYYAADALLAFDRVK
jgi:hypothetical protein